MFEDERSLPIMCPECGNIFQEQIGSLKSQNEIVCRCSSRYRYDNNKFRLALEKARAAVDDLYRSIGIRKD